MKKRLGGKKIEIRELVFSLLFYLKGGAWSIIEQPVCGIYNVIIGKISIFTGF